MMRWSTAALVFLSLPALAAAQRAVIMPMRSEIALSDSDLERITSALERAVRVEGSELVPGPSSEPCADNACVVEQMKQVAAHEALELTIWRAADQSISGVSVAIVRPSGERFSEGAEVAAPSELVGAIERATRGAYARMRRGPGPWLQIEGTPVGALISVDGSDVGVLPQKVKVSGGLHRVRVSHAGFEALEQGITVPRNPDALKQVSIALRTAMIPEARPGSARNKPGASPWNYVIGGVGIVAGVVLGVGPLRSASEDGACGRYEDGLCNGVVEFDGGEGLQLAAAAALFGSGIITTVWAPL